MAIEIPLYRSERFVPDPSIYSGPVPDYVERWDFTPPAGDPEAEPDAVLIAPDGARIGESASGTPCLYPPGLDAGAALAAARNNEFGLAVAVAVRLRALMEARGLRPADVARAAGMDRQTLHNILSGARANPGILTIERIVAAMGATLADLR